MSSFKFNRLSFLFLLLIFFISPRLVFSDGGDKKSYVLKDTVKVFAEKYLKIPSISSIATKISTPLLKTPVSIGVVTQALFESQHGNVIGDALKNISGVNVQNNFGIHDFFLIRGYESLSSGLVLTDGAAEPEASFYHLYNIDRIEVLKGPGAFLYGSNPLSGAVNIVRKQPVFKKFANITGSFGKFQSYRGNVDFGLVNSNSNLAFRLNALWQGSDNYREDTDNRTIAINPALTWQLNDESSLTVNLEYVNSNNKPDAGLPLKFVPNATFTEFTPEVPKVDRTLSYQSPFDKSNQELFRLRLDYSRHLSSSITLRNKFYFTKLNWNTIGTLMIGAYQLDPFNNPERFDVLRAIQGLNDEQNFIGNQLEALLSFKTASVTHKLLIGLEAARLADSFTLDVDKNIPTLNLNKPEDPLDGVDISQLIFFRRDYANSRSLLIAPYFVNQVTFSEKLRLIVGGRFDVIDYDDDDGFDKKSYQPAKTKRNKEKFSPMVGVTFSPVSIFSIYANAGQSFSPPTSFVDGDPKPEESTQFEAGAKAHFLNGQISSTVAFYQLKKENINFPFDIAQPPGTGDQRSRGIEVELSTALFKNWHTFFSYAYTDAKLTKFYEEVINPDTTADVLDRSGYSPAFVPEHILNLWTTKHFHNGFGFGFGAHYVSEQYIAVNNDVKIDDILTFDASLFYTFRNMRWSLHFKNLTNKNYLTRSGFFSNSVIPAKPFAVYGAIDVSL